jgi:hypothetical protein
MVNTLKQSNSSQTLTTSPKAVHHNFTPYLMGFALMLTPITTPSNYRDLNNAHRFFDNTSIGVTLSSRFSINNLYHIRNPAVVQLFINQELSSLLIELHMELSKYFPNTRFDLTYQEDPEESNLDRLWVYIMTDKEPLDALSTLDAFTESWWFDHINMINNRLAVNLEFI